MAEEIKPKVWTITIGSGEWSTVRYGIVEYLRKRPKMRAATAVAGLIWFIGYVASLSGFKLHLAWFPTISTFFVAPTLLWLAVVSGPEFCLVFGEPKPATPPVPPEAKGIVDPEGYGIEALNKSYTLVEGYGNSSFRWAITCLVSCLAFAGASALFSSGAIRLGSDIRLFAQVSEGSALAMFALCSIFLIRSTIMFRRASKIHDKLLDFQKAITALKFIERNKADAVSVDPGKVITNLLSPSERNTNAA